MYDNRGPRPSTFFSLRHGHLGGTLGGTRSYPERLEPQRIGLPSPLNPCQPMNFLILTRHRVITQCPTMRRNM